VVGIGSVNNAGALWDFAERSMNEGRHRFALDLSECRGLDSTFLGTLVGLSQEVGERSGAEGSTEGWVRVLNCSEANRELFEIVGADRYVRFRSMPEMEPIETQALPAGDRSLEERLALVRRAHENLIGIDRRNEERFSEFLKCLAAELAREG
jgi:anti-anti-sigma regulatory factor